MWPSRRGRIARPRRLLPAAELPAFALCRRARRGVGKALLDHVTAQADGPLSLKVQAPNLRAQAFYRREGFLCIEHGRDPGSDVAWLRLVRQRAATES